MCASDLYNFVQTPPTILLLFILCCSEKLSEVGEVFFDLASTFPVFSPLFLPSLDAFCQTLVDTLESTPGLRYIWSTFKPLLQGKVLYTPDTPAARLIVKEVSPERII